MFFKKTKIGLGEKSQTGMALRRLPRARHRVKMEEMAGLTQQARRPLFLPFSVRKTCTGYGLRGPLPNMAGKQWHSLIPGSFDCCDPQRSHKSRRGKV
jgi:hypothetical protein